MSINLLKHQFVTAVPENPEDGILYVSIQYRAAIHKCCCGCGHEVVTPLSPTDWKLIFDGVSISLNPSIGNWSLPCRSHYWIDRGKIKWAEQWSDEEIAAGRANDTYMKDKYYGATSSKKIPEAAPIVAPPKKGLWWQLSKWWS